MKIAAIVLNRNLPKVTDALCDKILKYNTDVDLYVVEAGSQNNLLSKYCTWHVNTEEVIKNGLRTPRGFNYALMKLWETDKFYNYDSFFFTTNDAEYQNKPFIEKLSNELLKHKKVGIITPCSNSWGEKQLLEEIKTKYFWYYHNISCLMRRGFIEDIMKLENPNEYNFLFDGNNFRGYLSELELVVKGYANDWATAITTEVMVEENEEYLKKNASKIKTESFEDNMDKYIKEGQKWIRDKYGFNSPWVMQKYSKFFFDEFFTYYPHLKKYKI